MSPTNGQILKVKEGGLDMSPMSLHRRTFRDRTFSKMAPGSLRGSIFALCVSAIGAGVLSLPYVLALCGWAVGIFLIFVGAVSGVWSNRLLAYRACEYNIPSYQKLCIKAGGSKLSLWLNICTLLYSIGCFCSYQIMIISLIKYAIKQFGANAETVDTKLFSCYLAIPIAVCLLIPMSL